MCHFINSSIAKRQTRKGIAGTAQTHFNVGEFKKLKIPLLTIAEQNEIVNQIEKITTKKEKIRIHAKNIETMKAKYLNNIWGA